MNFRFPRLPAGWPLPGRRAGWDSEQRSTAYICLVAGILLVIVSGAYAVANVRYGHALLLAFNAMGVAFGFLGIVAVMRRRLIAAMVFAFGGNAVYTFLGAYFGGNGNEVLFLVSVFTCTSAIRSSGWRRLVLTVVAVGSWAIVAHRLDPVFQPGIPRERILLNTGVGILIFMLFCDLFQRQALSLRREVEEKNRQLREANGAKERLLSIVSHDLCSPLGALKEGLAYLGDGRLSREEFGKVQSRLAEDVDHAFSTARSLLDWSAQRMDALATNPVPVLLGDACDAAMGLLRPMSERRTISVENRIASSAVVRADREQVRTLFRNLLSNALKYTPPGGSVVFESMLLENGCWEVAVRDTGIGMEPKRAACLFDPDYRESTPGLLQEKGLGLGLSLCREFVAAHGGAIRAESHPGQGTTIRFSLPG